MKHLTSIANLCKTDKGTTFAYTHGFTEFYDDFFSKYKDRTVNILEIGVDKGASLLMYNAFFDGQCNIYALDIEDKSEYNTENIKTFIVDQSNREQLMEFKKTIGDIKFDIILDDGSHWPEHQNISFFCLNDLLSEDGIYIIEDLHTYVWDNTEKSPLYSLIYSEPFGYLTEEESNELHSKINDFRIFGRKNDNAGNYGYASSLTCIITMK